MRVLVVNAGSSSLKLTLLDEDDNIIHARELVTDRVQVSSDELRATLQNSHLGEADAVGHRIVHGGELFREAVIIDAQVDAALYDLVQLAPLHQPKSLAALNAVMEALPELPAVACFDTAFHSTLPPAAATYALPKEWREQWRLRRYGFHGLSHAWVARRAPELIGESGGALRIVSCHLGAGASLCAIKDGKSIDTTMGFTPLEGLVMATRSGSVDPGLLLWLIENKGVSTGELADTLEHRSGLFGLAGSADMREIVSRAVDVPGTDAAVDNPHAAIAPDPDAVLALQVYIHRLCGSIAAMAAALGGIDVLAFTGGVGENSTVVRAKTAAGLRFMGVEIDVGRNDETTSDGIISATGADVDTVVVTAREDIEIARQVRALLST